MRAGGWSDVAAAVVGAVSMCCAGCKVAAMRDTSACADVMQKTSAGGDVSVR